MTHENRDVTRSLASDHDHSALPDDLSTDNESARSDPDTGEDALAIANEQFSRGRDGDHDDGNDDDDAHVAEDGEEEDAAKPPSTSRRIIANWVIAKRLHDVLKPIQEKKPFCLLIEVPEASWSEPIADAIGDLTGRLSLFRRMRDRIVTIDDLPRRSSNERLREKCLHPLVRGEPLVIVLNQPFKHLPNDIIGLIDHHAVLRPLDTKDLLAIIEEFTQTSVPVIGDDLATGLTLDQIAGAIRPRDNPTAMIQRLHALRQSANRTRSIAVPKLQDLSGYGEAKVWGLRLSREIDRYRAGEITLADLPKGLLLSGPPGCGKTLFAQSLAVTCNIPIVPSSVADWLQNGDGHLGDVMLAVKKVFDTAHQQQKPAVLFLDECDAFIDPNRTRDRSNWWQTLRAGVLSSIDGASTEPGLIILGACNYPELVDPALRRSGRLDRHIQIPLPDAYALASMLQSALADELPDADYQRYGKDIIGSTGADVARFVREIRARARDFGRNVTVDDVEAVLSPPDQRPADLIRRIAFHESGHAVVASLLDRDVKAVSLSKADTGFGGYVLATRPMIFTHASIEEEVLIGLAGRASEVMFGLAASSGASADLVEVTRLLVRAHGSYGFGSSLSSIDETADTQQLLMVDTRLKQIVDNDLDRLWRRTLMIVEQNAHAIRSVAELLIERRHLDEEEISQIIARCRSAPAMISG